MQINKADLVKALEIVKPGLASKEIIEQSTSFAFMGNKIVTYNDEISISHPVEGLDLTGAIKAEELYNLLHKLKKEEIELDIDEKETVELRIVCGKAKAGLTLQQEIKLPIGDIGTVGKFKSIPDGFLKGMELSMGCASRDMSKPVLTCVHVNQEGFIEASDGYRISKSMIGVKFPVKTFLIPSTSVVNVIRMNPIKIAEGDGWIHFKSEAGTILSCRIFEDDKFPDTTPFLKVKGTEITLPASTQDVLDKAMVFCKRDHMLDESVDITLGNKRLKVESKSDAGWFEEEVNIKYTGDPVLFSITPYLLKDILKETLICTICQDRLKFSGDNWVYITVLKNKGK
jgi:DNA polymerase III sliding clamp (beta) subunit (PCNA family)